MAFRCIKGCKTATGRDRTFQNVGNCTNHYKDVHQIDMTEEQALKHCLVGSKASMKLKPFQPDDGSVPMVVVPAAAAAVPNDLASVAVSSMGSLGLSRMGLDATEQVLLLATLANHRAASAALAAAAAAGGGGGTIEEGDEDGDEDGDEEEEGKSTRSSSRLKIGKKLRKSTK